MLKHQTFPSQRREMRSCTKLTCGASRFFSQIHQKPDVQIHWISLLFCSVAPGLFQIKCSVSQSLFVSVQDKDVEEWKKYVDEQLKATEGIDRLSQFRDIVKKRLAVLSAFGSSAASESEVLALSPTSKQTKADAFSKENVLDNGIFKNFEKRFSSYKTSLGNATERLIQCHKEECRYLSFSFCLHLRKE